MRVVKIVAGWLPSEREPMAIVEIEISPDAIAVVDADAQVSAVPHRTYEEYRRAFAKAANDASEAAPERAAILGLLSVVCSFSFRTNADGTVFGPRLQIGDKRSESVSDLGDLDLKIVRDLLAKTKDDLLLARLLDVLSVRERKRADTEAAIDSYLAAADLKNTQDPYVRLETEHLLTRCASVAQGLGRKNAPLAKVIAHIEAALPNVVPRLALHMLGLLTDLKEGDASARAAVLDALATKALADRQFDFSRRARDLEVTWRRRAKDDGGALAARTLRAETYVAEAEDAIVSRPFQKYLTATAFIEQAIVAYREIGGAEAKARVDELHAKLLEYQARTPEEMGFVGHDLSKVVADTRARALKHIAGKNGAEQLGLLAFDMVEIPSLSAIKESVLDGAKESPLQFLLQAKQVSSLGKNVAERESLVNDDDSINEQALLQHAHVQAKERRKLIVACVIDAVRQQMVLEHHISRETLMPFLVHNPIVEHGRELLFADGLAAGFNGEFHVSTHLLVPQFEHAVRHLFRANGWVTSGLDSDLTQDETDLNKLLFRPEIVALFGDDVVFNLKGILVERFGSNLRNQMAHGLLPFGAFSDPDNQYFWWLMLRMCLAPGVTKASEAAPEAADSAPVEPSPDD